MEHGLTAYANGSCRCGQCRKVWAEYIRGRRQRGKRARTRRAKSGRAYFAAKEQDRLVRLTRLGAELLEAAVARTGKDGDDIVEALLRECADHVTFAA